LLRTYCSKPNVELEKLPESLQEDYANKRSPHNGKIQLGLEQGYNLLNDLGDRLGQIYQQQGDRIRNVLAVRHNSLFAHGLHPISSSEYQQASEVILEFIDAGMAVVVAVRESQPVQFPKNMNFN
jgi:tRNA 2-selenouridine synthase SelU